MDAVFIDSDYEKNREAKKTVDFITKECIFENDIVIATSVLDNGVSIKDIGLRNLIVLAECEEEFIQMIGRKREDGEKVNLYLCTRSLSDFSRRLTYMEKIQKAYHKCQEYILKNQQIEIVEELLNNAEFYRSARKFLYQIKCTTSFGWQNGNIFPILCINPFSIIALSKKIQFCRTLLDRFKEEGELAFLRTQMEWLDMSVDDIEKVVVVGSEERKDYLRKKLEEVLRELTEKKLSKAENIDVKLDRIRPILDPLLKIILEKEKYKQFKELLRKNDRTFSPDKFNECMNYIGLMFEMMEGKEKNTYIIYSTEK